MELTDERWERVEPVFRHKRKPGQVGRPPRDPRRMVDGVLWILRTGAPWADLPSRYPPYQTCHRWFQRWCKDGAMKQLLIKLARDLRRQRIVDDVEGFIDGSYVPAKKGGDCVGKSRAGSTTKIMALADSCGLPLAVTIAEGCCHDVSLVDQTLDETVIDKLPAKLIADKAFDSAKLASALQNERHVELIAPKRATSRRRAQDGRALRRYRRRWKVERLFGWMKRFRRVAVRWEASATNYLGFVQLAAALVILRAL